MSTFQKRHYEAIAQALQQAYSDALARNPKGDNAAIAAHGVSLAREALADMFQRDNGMLKRSRFANACEPGANVRARTAHLVASGHGDRQGERSNERLQGVLPRGKY